MQEGGGEVCLEEEVVRLHELGLSAEEIAGTTGLEVGWIQDLLSRISD